MSKTITIAGQKGGTGKSVTAVNLASSLALIEKNTLLIDCDPQGCATKWSGINEKDYNFDISSVLSGRAKVKDAIIKSQFSCLDVMPAGFSLFQVALKLVKNLGNEKLLRLFLRDIDSLYDYIIIDSPSSYSFLSTAAMTAADWLLICMTRDYGSSEDFRSLLRMVKHIRTIHKVPLKIAGLLFNRVQSDKDIHSFLEEKELADIEGMVYKSFIPDDRNVQKAIDCSIPIALHDIRSPASAAYLDFAKEIHFSFNE